MITKFITDVSTRFNPFSPRAKTCRSFLSHLPPNARQTMKINAKLLPRDSKEASFLNLKFSRSIRNCHEGGAIRVERTMLTRAALVSTEDGKEMNLDTEKLKIRDVMEEVDRHSRMLHRQEALTGN
jgi:large subunit ribosomal protein L53